MGRDRIALGGARLLFGRMYEDASVDEAVLADAGRIFAIASAGDTALRLARRDRRVTAVDLHPAQVAYVRARAAGHRVRDGSVDRLLGVARLAGRLAGWSQELLSRFLLLDDPESQARAFDRLLSTRRRRAVLAAGLHPVVLRLGYAAPFVSRPRRSSSGSRPGRSTASRSPTSSTGPTASTGAGSPRRCGTLDGPALRSCCAHCGTRATRTRPGMPCRTARCCGARSSSRPPGNSSTTSTGADPHAHPSVPDDRLVP